MPLWFHEAAPPLLSTYVILPECRMTFLPYVISRVWRRVPFVHHKVSGIRSLYLQSPNFTRTSAPVCCTTILDMTSLVSSGWELSRTKVVEYAVGRILVTPRFAWSSSQTGGLLTQRQYTDRNDRMEIRNAKIHRSTSLWAARAYMHVVCVARGLCLKCCTVLSEATILH